jgi:hypothetical protein
MTLSRTKAAVVALSSAVLIAGCGGSDPSSGSGSGASTPAPAPTQTPTQDAAVVWADGVCSASTKLGDSVRDAGKALQADPASSATSLDQARAQVRDRVAAVQQEAASLKSALSAVPAGAGPELTAAQQQLQTASQRAKGSIDQLGAAAGQVTDAGTASEMAAGLVTLKAAFAETATDVATYRESLRSTVNGTEHAVRSAFGAAPACRDIVASRTATATSS